MVAKGVVPPPPADDDDDDDDDDSGPSDTGGGGGGDGVPGPSGSGPAPGPSGPAPGPAPGPAGPVPGPAPDSSGEGDQAASSRPQAGRSGFLGGLFRQNEESGPEHAGNKRRASSEHSEGLRRSARVRNLLDLED
jgi:hypothetical protein